MKYINYLFFFASLKNYNQEKYVFQKYRGYLHSKRLEIEEYYKKTKVTDDSDI